MLTTIINDCKDENAKGRQVARAQALFNAPVHFIGVSNDVEASGNLVDALDAAQGATHLVLVNVAPRAKKSWWLGHDFPVHTNGTPFCYFVVGRALVLASQDGYTLSLVKKLRLAEEIRGIEYDAATSIIADHNLIQREEVSDLRNTQFRSFNFLPRIASLLLRGVHIPSFPLTIADIPDAPRDAWVTDNFGNVKTTVTNHEVAGAASVAIFNRDIPLYPRLSDIPDGTLGASVGSSGYGRTRFVEVFVQGGSAAKELAI